MSEAATPPTQVVALGYSIVGSISDNAQITFHHAIAEDESDASVNAKLDRIMGLIDRQRLKYEAPALRKELADLKDMNAQSTEDMANSEANYNKAQADLDVQIETFQKKAKELHDVGYARHQHSGRGGSYVPKGNDAQQIAAAKAGVDAAVEAKARNDAERKQFLENIGVSTSRREARIAMIEGKLAEIDKLVT